jgi:GLPGLI family protein
MKMKTGQTLVSLLWFLALPTISIAQLPQPVIARVFYKFNHQYDTLQPNLSKTGTYILLLGKSSSVYKSYDRMLQDSEMMANLKLTGAMAPPSGKRANGQELYFYFDAKKAFWRNKLMGDYVMEKPFPALDWKIWAETKEIEHILCQKATVNYMGRNYTAWFSANIPFQAGPWKLNGLPGLILTAYDETGRIRFDFAGFQQVKNSDEKTAWDKSAVKTTWEDYQKIGKAIENDPKGYFERTFGGKLTTSAPMPHRNPFVPDITMNFPLEIGDKIKK